MPTILVDLDDFYALVGDGYQPARIEDDLELVKGEFKCGFRAIPNTRSD